jgi:hypothetical protein
LRSYLKEKAAPVKKTEITAVGFCRADHTPQALGRDIKGRII